MSKPPSSLRRTLAVQMGVMSLALVLLAAGAGWGVSGLHADFGVALRGYQELHDIYEVGYHATTAKLALQGPRQDVSKAAAEAQAALATFDRYAAGAAWRNENDADQTQLRSSLSQAASLLSQSPQPLGQQRMLEAQTSLSSALESLVRLSASAQQAIETSQRSADAKQKITLIFVIALGAAAVAVAIAVGIRQYRAVVRPLESLSAGVRQLANRQFAGRIDAAAPGLDLREFAALAADFNRMAEALDHFYRELENQVREKSRELVRSERLASVGYLAAGVAHEINNPLGIIAGYAESTLADVKDAAEAAPAPQIPIDRQVESALKIICEEAFRCKQIIDRLLSLSRGGSENRQKVNLADIARQVIDNLKGLRNSVAAAVEIEFEPKTSTGDTIVLAREGEMKQVVLNLALNALQAVEAMPPGQGKVAVSVRRIAARDAAGSRPFVELSVCDNGRGMTAAVQERIFEPFFTEGAGSSSPDDSPGSRRGTGLGLSITHAIVTEHGGQIRPASEGKDKGSRFIVTLPAAES